MKVRMYLKNRILVIMRIGTNCTDKREKNKRKISTGSYFFNESDNHGLVDGDQLLAQEILLRHRKKENNRDFCLFFLCACDFNTHTHALPMMNRRPTDGGAGGGDSAGHFQRGRHRRAADSGGRLGASVVQGPRFPAPARHLAP